MAWKGLKTDEISQNFITITKLPRHCGKPIIGIIILKTLLFAQLHNMFR
jgi:hypothetical protein